MDFNSAPHQYGDRDDDNAVVVQLAPKVAGSKPSSPASSSKAANQDIENILASLEPDYQEAENFLTLLDEGQDKFTFQTFDDDRDRKDGSLTKIFHGSLEEHFAALDALNSRGTGIFVTVQETDGKGRKNANITHVRAIFQEDDKGFGELPTTPHIVVESSPGKHHRYVLTDHDNPDDFDAVQQRMVDDYGSDPNAKDKARVLRLPGFYHLKDRNKPYRVKVVAQSNEQPLPWSELIKLYPPVPERTYDKPPRPTHNQGDLEKCQTALAYIDPDIGYIDWLRIGAALHHASSGSEAGLAMWETWSSKGTTYRRGECAYRWRTFSSTGPQGKTVTAATLFRFAKLAGWSEVVDDDEKDGVTWQNAAKLYPRVQVPWHILPDSLTGSLKQLARSCATSASPLIGVCLAVIASVIGRAIHVSPKSSWKAILAFWFADIRPSGSGKTPAARKLCKPLVMLQENADEIYEQAISAYLEIPKKDRGEPPKHPGGYFMTNLTIESITPDLRCTGGLLIIQDELSSFVSGQNQYKGGGNDRESWLSIFDGNAARTGRAGSRVMVKGIRLSMAGGIQPEVWRRTFTSDTNKIMLDDGTIFRFLPLYEPDKYYELTGEAWSDDNEKLWNKCISTAASWADKIMEESPKGLTLIFDEEAKASFFEWANQTRANQFELPKPLRGFIPKAIEYVLRATGALHCLDAFCRGREPSKILTISDLNRGIELVEFYLGQIVSAMQVLCTNEKPDLVTADSSSLALVKSLKNLCGQLDKNRLPVGVIADEYNRHFEKHDHLSSRGMGSMLRDLNFKIMEGQRAGGKSKVNCLFWDEAVTAYIKKIDSLAANVHKSTHPQNQSEQVKQPVDVQKAMSTEPIITAEDVGGVDVGLSTSTPQDSLPVRDCGHGDLWTSPSAENGVEAGDDEWEDIP